MSTPTDSQSLLTASKCFMCYGVSQAEAMELALLAIWAGGSSPASTLLNGIELVWHFDADVIANTGEIDAVQGYKLNINNIGGGQPSTVSGLLNNAVQFNVVNFQLNCLIEPVAGANSFLHLTGDRTFSLWFNASNAAGGIGQLCGVGNLLNTALSEWTIWYNPGVTTVSASFWDSAGNGHGVNGSAPLNQWNNVIVVFSLAAKSFTLYVNGVSAGTVSIPTLNIQNGTTFAIGDDGMDDFELGFKMDEMNVWNRQLNSTEIAEVYNAGVGIAYPY